MLFTLRVVWIGTLGAPASRVPRGGTYPCLSAMGGRENVVPGTIRRTLALLAAWCVLGAAGSPAAYSEVLQGRVSVEDELLRINRPAAGAAPDRLRGNGESTRIARPAAGFNGAAGRPLVDTTAFAPPLSGQAKQDDFKLGVVKADQFKMPPPNNFDLGAERNSRELVLAWERWHRQLSQAIYSRWSARASSPGQATVRVTVTSDRSIRADIVSSTGGRQFQESLLDAIEGLTGNPGLTFPSKSRRRQVTFEGDYIASPNVRPGYSWVKNDYERVREEW